MKTFVIYDIEDDKTRTRISEICKDYGLARTQYSTFFGEMNHNRREEIHLKIARTLGERRGKVVICPVCDKDLKLLKTIDTYIEVGYESESN